MAEPGVEYSNEFTRMIARVRDGGGGRIESPVVGAPMPNVRSAAMSAVPPLTIEERAVLDAKAIELGVMPAAEGEAGPYGSLAEAQDVGRPVEVPPYSYPPGLHPGDKGFVSMGLPRLPDFADVGGIDLIRGVVYLGGMEFKMPDGDVAQYRLYVLSIARAEITRQMDEAMKQFAPAPVTEVPDDDTAPSEDVSEVQDQ